MSEHTYKAGGYVGGGLPASTFRLHPDECLFRAEDVRAGRFRCGRDDHPTAGSTCGIVVTDEEAEPTETEPTYGVCLRYQEVRGDRLAFSCECNGDGCPDGPGPVR